MLQHDKLIASLRRDNEIKLRKIHSLVRPEAHHAWIVTALDEVASRMAVAPIPIVIHRDSVRHTFYHAKCDCIVLSDRLNSLLNPLEMRAILAHELDHKARKHVFVKMFDIGHHLERRGAFNDACVVSAFNKSVRSIRTMLEIRADKSACTLYGASNLENALIKIISGMHEPIDQEFTYRIRLIQGYRPTESNLKVR